MKEKPEISKKESFHMAAEVSGETFTRITQHVTQLVLADQAKLKELRAPKKKKNQDTHSGR